MNLHNLVASAVAQINPTLTATLKTSTGSTINADGSRSPTYSISNVTVQIQALTYQDLKQIDGLNIEGLRQSMYMNGDTSAIIRVNDKGGDVITLTTGEVWLVAQVLERWYSTAGWVKIVCTLQNGNN